MLLLRVLVSNRQNVEATIGFEPMNKGFADPYPRERMFGS